jgi:hypothetical protein
LASDKRGIHVTTDCCIVSELSVLHTYTKDTLQFLTLRILSALTHSILARPKRAFSSFLLTWDLDPSPRLARLNDRASSNRSQYYDFSGTFIHGLLTDILNLL